MSKVKKEGMRHYELLCLISNKFTEDEAKEIIVKAKTMLEEKGGKITYSEDWGKKRLAYPIKEFAYGYYGLVEFDLDGVKLAGVENNLRMNSDILRHQIVVKKVRTEEQIAKDKKIAQKIAKKKQEEEKEEKEEVMVKKVEKNKVGLEDLDEKLDKILETEDLL